LFGIEAATEITLAGLKQLLCFFLQQIDRQQVISYRIGPAVVIVIER